MAKALGYLVATLAKRLVEATLGKRLEEVLLSAWFSAALLKPPLPCFGLRGPRMKPWLESM
jgi:hypothetical protein